MRLIETFLNFLSFFTEAHHCASNVKFWKEFAAHHADKCSLGECLTNVLLVMTHFAVSADDKSKVHEGHNPGAS